MKERPPQYADVRSWQHALCMCKVHDSATPDVDTGAGIKNILATADGNVAVDNIAMGLAKAGVKVVRVGRPEKVSSIIEDLTLDALIAKRKVDDAAAQERAAAAAADAARAAKGKAIAEEVAVLRDVMLALSLEDLYAEEAKLLGEPEATLRPRTPPSVRFASSVRPALDGRYVLCPSGGAMPAGEDGGGGGETEDRPVYVREEGSEGGGGGVGEGGQDAEGAAPVKIFCFFAEIKGRKGWYLAERKGSVLSAKRRHKKKGILGFSPVKDAAPPAGGWQVKEDGAMVADSGGFVCETEGQADVVARVCALRERQLWALFESAQADTSAQEQRQRDTPGWEPVGKGGGGVELDAAEALKVQRRRDWDMGMEILREADVICAQMISAGGDFLRGLGAFNAILIDEVAQDWMHACMQASKQACIHTDT